LGIYASIKGGAILEWMVARKTACLRRLGGSRGGELQAGRFFANPKVTAAKIVEGWSRLTGAAVAGRHVLAIQDTTEPTSAPRAPRSEEMARRLALFWVWRHGPDDATLPR
jgi:hypothetical protein